MIVVEHPTRSRARNRAADDLRQSFADDAGTSPCTRTRVSRRVIREVPVLGVGGRLGDAVADLDHAIQLALAEQPRGVVCDLSAVSGDADPRAVEALATAGRHVRDWPGIPVALACPDRQLRERLAAHPLRGGLLVTESLFSAVSAVRAAPALAAVARLRLAPHPTAPRASRDFVTRTLLDWCLGRVIPFATALVGELVASSTTKAGTYIDVSVVWDRGVLRLSVRDHGPALSDQRPCALAQQRRGRNVVAGLSRASGTFPSADGGQLVWALLDAPRLRPPVSRIGNERPIPVAAAPVFVDGRGLTDLPFCAGSGLRAPALRRADHVACRGDHLAGRALPGVASIVVGQRGSA